MANDPNLELVQASYADFMNGDMAAFLDQCTDDIAWTTPYPSDVVPFGGTWTGKDGVQAFFTNLPPRIASPPSSRTSSLRRAITSWRS